MSQPLVLSVVLLCLASVLSTTFAFPSEKQTSVELIASNDLSKTKNFPLGAKLVSLTERRTDGRSFIIYSLGQRLQGDELVSQASDSVSWETSQDVELMLTYPKSGKGATITFVEIIVEQSSADGQAFVLLGGIGENEISIKVEAYNTMFFNFVSKIYGYN